ncbi:PIN domain-containing protein [Acidicapsa ligni]|uniref:PIN domain-containing protein n=1 Tax=Acidicapsa ligni TaxID=542300 RepID=UPI0021E098DD|nr:PIN domain-containing protein [Acidicapsa ligni]
MILTPDNEYFVVLDACVLAPMPLCDTLLRCAEEPAFFRVLWSEQILEEVSRTLDKFGYTSSQAQRRIRFMREAFPEACLEVPPHLIEAVPNLPDPDDRHVVAAAIHGHAHAIVTANLRDFPQELLAPHEILVESPDQFLMHQFHLNRDRMLEVLDTQAGGIGRSREDVLEKLQTGVPGFVDLLCR